MESPTGPQAGRGGVALILGALFLLGAVLGLLGPASDPGALTGPPRFGAAGPSRPVRTSLVSKLPATLAGLLVLGALSAYPWRRRDPAPASEVVPFLGASRAGGLGAVHLPRGRPPAW